MMYFSLRSLSFFLGLLVCNVALAQMSGQEMCTDSFGQLDVSLPSCSEPTKIPPPPEISNKVMENHIFFLKGGTSLGDGERKQIDALVGALSTGLMADACLLLVGHSDSSGSQARNLELSMERANLIARILKNALSSSVRTIEVAAEGEARSLSGFASSSLYNRRVEIFARKCR